ncbi:hypothetical protein scyTo_0024802, partial [Scyliorhinus torazame]|nr:hypothetical protein [Scyliorhinus torazame]
MPPSLSKSGSIHSIIDGETAESDGRDLFNDEKIGSLSKDADAPIEDVSLGSEFAPATSFDCLKENTFCEEEKLLRRSVSRDSIFVKPEGLTPDSVPPDFETPFLDPPMMSSVHASIIDSLMSESKKDLIPSDTYHAFLHEQPRSLNDSDDQSVGNRPKLFRDPLQDDTDLFITEHVTSSEDRLKSYSVAFKQELKDVILCISPFITFREPFLLTNKGMKCPTRDYFPEQVYWSPLLHKDIKEIEFRRKKQLLKDLTNLQGLNGNVQAKSTQILPSHDLLSTRITHSLGNNQSLSKLLADYRARGGRIKNKVIDPFMQSKEDNPKTVMKDGEDESQRGQIHNELMWPTK